MPEPTTATAPPLTRAMHLAYGVGQFAWASKDVCFHYFLFFYYTQFLGLTASLAGFAAMLALIADGISDPLIGSISDNWKSKRGGRRHPFMLAAIVPYTLALLAIFNPPASLEQGQLFAWYLVCAITVRTFLTLFTVPHMALGAELTDDYGERTTVATYRNTLGYIGGLIIQICAWFLIIPAATEAGDVVAGYRNVGTFAAGLAMLAMGLACFGTRARIPHLIPISKEQAERPWYFAFRFGLGSFIAGLFIDIAGFEGVQVTGDVTRDMALRLGWLYGPGLMVFTIVGIVIYSRYRLSRSRYNEIRAQLDNTGYVHGQA